MKNMTQLSNLDLDDICNLFSRKDLSDSDFQDTIVKVLCLGKSFQISIREKYGLKENNDVTDQLIPSTFNEETDFLSGNNMDVLKRHYMKCYWEVRKDFLDYLDDSMSQDSLIDSTVNTISRRSVSCASNLSSVSAISVDTKTSKASSKISQHDLYPKNHNHAFMPKPDFEGYRRNAKKESEENQDSLAEELHQEPDHPTTFMNMIKSRTHAISAADDERLQVLPAQVIWDGCIDRFEVIRNNVEANYRKIDAGYLFDSSFQEAYLKKGVDCYIDFF
jgi:hypothetical protein